jgi:TrmH family RNA methyltransferase
LITSRRNAKIKLARALRQRKHRDASGLFLVEGIRHVGEAMEAGAQIEAIYYAPEMLSSQFAQDLIERQAAHGLPCYAVAADVFDSLVDKENPQGILAVVHKGRLALSGLGPGNFPWGVALVEPQDPGNVGTILRAIDAVGASGLILLENSVDPYHATAVRASMGALFWHPVVAASFAEFAGWARENGYHVYGTSAHAEQDYREVGVYQRPLILLMGSEREGLANERAAICEQMVRLPMKGKVTSLNLAVATGVMLYEVLGSLEGGDYNNRQVNKLNR